MNWIYTSVAAFIGVSFLQVSTAPTTVPSEMHLVASTPCDQQIKATLAIPAETAVDFIRWDLVLKDASSSSQTFTLKIHYGESKPNTLNFINDGYQKEITGEFNITPYNEKSRGEVYRLTSRALTTEILLLKVTDNLFHLLTPQKALMIGNGGWSYTLNRKEPLQSSTGVPAFTLISDVPADTARQIIFHGRTPCQDFASEHEIAVTSGCFKLKWKLILNKDPKTLQPTGYTLHRTNSRENVITGKWKIVRGMPANPNAVIYQLDPDKPSQSISLLLGDEHVAFFLHKSNQLFTGNENFSYTLDMR